MSFRTCRLCRKWTDEDHLVKYGVRHYAHPRCFLEAGRKLDELHGWQIGMFPAKLILARGLEAEATRLIAANHYPTRRRNRAKPF